MQQKYMKMQVSKHLCIHVRKKRKRKRKKSALFLCHVCKYSVWIDPRASVPPLTPTPLPIDYPWNSNKNRDWKNVCMYIRKSYHVLAPAEHHTPTYTQTHTWRWQASKQASKQEQKVLMWGGRMSLWLDVQKENFFGCLLKCYNCLMSRVKWVSEWVCSSVV